MSTLTTRSARRHRCDCDHVFQVFGLGRHRRFYELDDLGWTRPVMTNACPHCRRQLPSTLGRS
jgi:hypothetical protein